MRYTDGTVLDVVLEGRRRVVPLEGLDLGDLSGDSDVLRAAADALGVGVEALASHSVLRLPTGRVLVRLPLVEAWRRAGGRAVRRVARSMAAAWRGLDAALTRAWRAAVRFVRPLGLALAPAVRAAASCRRALFRLAGRALRWVQAPLARVLRALDGALARTGGAAVRLAERWARALAGPLGRALRAAARGAGAAARVLVRARAAAAGVLSRSARVVARILAPMVRLLARAGAAVLTALRVAAASVGRLGSLLGRMGAFLGRLGARAVAPLRRLGARALAPLRRLAALAASWLAGRVHRIRRVLAARWARLVEPARAWARVLRDLVFGVAVTLWTGRTPEERERDHRLAALESLLTNPRRGLGALWAVHRPVVRDDPLFYVRLAAWYFRHGEMRDHREVFVAHLVLSPLSDLREAGLALLRRLPPHQVASVVDFVRGRVVRSRWGRPVRVGLFRNPPRSLRTEVARYLREREASPEAFDGAVLVARSAMKRLYAGLHLRPGPRAQAVLFEGAAPEGSRLADARRLAVSRDPSEQARLVRSGRLPFRTLMGRLGRPAPEVVEAVVERMTPQEVLNHLAALERWGGLDLPAVRRRLRRGPVAAMKAPAAARAAGLGGDWADFLGRLAHDNLRRRARLTRATALLVDASASMERSLEVGRKVAAMLAAVADAPLHVYTFAAEARRLRADGGDYEAWTRAFASVEARGPTSAGAALVALLEEGSEVEQIVVVTDQRENHRPAFSTVLRRLRRRRAVKPTFCFVTLEGAPSARTSGPVDRLHRQCNALGFESADYRFAGDDSTLAELLPLVTRPSRLRLLQEILATELPRRAAA